MSTGFETIPTPNIYPPDLKRVAHLTGVPQALAALGTNQGSAAPITASMVFVNVTGADATKGVILPADAAGAVRTVYNNSASTLKVYPPTGGAIDAAGANAALVVGAHSVRAFVFVSATVISSMAAVDSATDAASALTNAATAQAAIDALNALFPVKTAELSFTETTGAGVYTGSFTLPAGATLLDIVVNGVALWTATTSATLKVGDVANDAGYFTGVDLKATDLLAGESLSLSFAGGKAGAYVANSQVSPRYATGTRVISGIVTTVGGAGNAGRTRMTIYYSVNTAVAATKV